MKCWVPLRFDEKEGEHIGVDMTVLRIWLVQIPVHLVKGERFIQFEEKPEYKIPVHLGISLFCPYSPIAASRRNVASAQEVVS